jgi:hypothetical protein
MQCKTSQAKPETSYEAELLAYMNDHGHVSRVTKVGEWYVQFEAGKCGAYNEKFVDLILVGLIRGFELEHHHVDHPSGGSEGKQI